MPLISWQSAFFDVLIRTQTSWCLYFDPVLDSLSGSMYQVFVYSKEAIWGSECLWKNHSEMARRRTKQADTINWFQKAKEGHLGYSSQVSLPRDRLPKRSHGLWFPDLVFQRYAIDPYWNETFSGFEWDLHPIDASLIIFILLFFSRCVPNLDSS